MRFSLVLLFFLVIIATTCATEQEDPVISESDAEEEVLIKNDPPPQCKAQKNLASIVDDLQKSFRSHLQEIDGCLENTDEIMKSQMDLVMQTMCVEDFNTAVIIKMNAKKFLESGDERLIYAWYKFERSFMEATQYSDEHWAIQRVAVHHSAVDVFLRQSKSVLDLIHERNRQVVKELDQLPVRAESRYRPKYMTPHQIYGSNAHLLFDNPIPIKKYQCIPIIELDELIESSYAKTAFYYLNQTIEDHITYEMDMWKKLTSKGEQDLFEKYHILCHNYDIQSVYMLANLYNEFNHAFTRSTQTLSIQGQVLMRDTRDAWFSVLRELDLSFEQGTLVNSLTTILLSSNPEKDRYILERFFYILKDRSLVHERIRNALKKLKNAICDVEDRYILYKL